ncbi:phosphoribosylformylglycinamidine synthase ii : Phosphoribosylformylglycinamidine synthase subunit PurL OS=Pirellula staleyi (strain ATCC 27377 / DSM 6068 / ICPB 4128) GN=purL PE=3 SV=1: AIRS: AIRS_C: AIRS: AIRS_C [Tuwongella immobilis]|uniref:Phosphoribosylformylglycinamidine synthase subunit PurL n=1 Tax=Tuwongella immobilis TaxID=692036 RepID=A0A6C2YJD5_9BACT|nr:phosphoribosylformylglycinamidine synthase subunit PurL [Tuwongella immobilis]VIP01678.1 phosphoribosylformylglycinamidine synthase ii : Phosphoribosylformylglycinamidine synthase subunit PurL OS=Pirellula staleyi (strain ATCC 27377 / DSM 6068 / ICPB 4128) GN=purL PE=3 SV=1: AIRS: AIRS_C: AIRS: AIRS_C [Tuwongella immobilis]VTR99122.1 phosphoribosylformylglycinamidine synthase ii : Phosphoribosylformylglycinamidine synthase subunit PurL OS=Pirellula staleyi (strain ATCC 27377 / DSM 6068 / ICPB 
MLWEVEIRPIGRDAERERVCDEYDWLTHSQRGGDLITAAARGYLLEGNLSLEEADALCVELLVDPLLETSTLTAIPVESAPDTVTVLLKPGVMDPTAQSVLEAAARMNIPVSNVRTFRRYFGPVAAVDDAAIRKVLANDAIEQIVVGPLTASHLSLGKPTPFQLVTVPLRDADDATLEQISRQGQLALALDEMQIIQTHFRELQRDPTDIELETIAQTWSEHCSHKTLRSAVRYDETIDGVTTTKHFGNLLKETIFGATQTIREQLGDKDWCVSVFVDNAGVVTFNDEYHVCFKVETHNHPSAIEPYGGANTGLGGVIRDPLGTGLGAKPICNTDVFCFAPPDTPPESLPPGVLHPRRVMQGVVAGVRDYGNRMGIPTVNGAVLFDPAYLGNPLVFCGTVGLIPVNRIEKAAKPGDLIVALGGRTGRDGIHGATFSSLELTDESEKVSGGAVQIGNAITEKKVLDVVLAARDRGLFHAVTDCGAGGFSSAVGEMAAEIGADVQLELAPLKYDGLTYTEIWISESQERMVLAVPEADWPALQALAESEDVEAAVLGRFTDTGRLKLSYHGNPVGELDLHFLHEGRPKLVRAATWTKPPEQEPLGHGHRRSPHESLLAILSSYSVCSKEWIIRQYDHEVQGGSVIKPLVGVRDDGPSDAAVVMPILGDYAGIAIGCGINPQYGKLDPGAMAGLAIDEAVRNVVAVGADPAKIAILDNFCWANVRDPEVLGALVRTAEACRDVAVAYGTPFISGKDSLNNEFRSPERTIAIPSTLLVSALGQIADVRTCVTMDLKAAGHLIYQVGVTKPDLGGSHYHMVQGITGGRVPQVDLELAPKVFRAMHAAISAGLVRSCHDLSEGGLATALAEMAFAGEIGVDVTSLDAITGPEPLSDIVRLYSESPTRFVVEVPEERAAAFEQLLAGIPLAKIGVTVKEPRLRIADSNGEWLIWAKLSELKDAWQKPLAW